MTTEARADSYDVLKISDPSELLAYVPHALGFQPEDSVVLMSIRAPRGRVGLVARVDLPDLHSERGEEVLERLGAHLYRDGAAAVAAVIYSPRGKEAAELEEEKRSARRILDLVECCADMPPLLDAWLVGSNRYLCLTCDCEECCPEQGRPLDELESTSVAAAFVMAGSAPAPDRASLAPGLEANPRARAAFARALTAERARVEAGEVGPRDRVCRAVAVLTGERTASRPALARVAALVADKLLRDAVIAQLIDADCLSIERNDLDAVFSRAYSEQATAPDRARVDRAVETLARAIRLASGQDRANLLGMRAWLCWWSGDGAAAAVNAEEASDLDPSQRLAILVLRAVEGGLAPGWAR